jgi:hypothetical protein
LTLRVTVLRTGFPMTTSSVTVPRDRIWLATPAEAWRMQPQRRPHLRSWKPPGLPKPRRVAETAAFGTVT